MNRPLRGAIFFWAIASIVLTVYLVDQRSYRVTWHYLLEFFLLPAGVTFLLTALALIFNWLDYGGALVSMAVGLAHNASHVSLLAALLAFFVSSSIATGIGKTVKRRVDPSYKKGGQRNLVQVFSNGVVATTACQLYLWFAPPGVEGWEPLSFQVPDFALLSALASMGALAGCCGDTWASEFGVLQGNILPRHILTWKPVPAGTNGGVSFIGTICSALGGLLVGFAFFLGMEFELLMNQDIHSLFESCWPIIPLGMLAGFLCSLIDSLIGATLQYSGLDTQRNCVVNGPGPGVRHISGRDILDNHAVNLLSSLLTAMLIPLFIYLAMADKFAMEAGYGVDSEAYV